jgi:UDP-N-acetylmuramate: L-alanyl-gamma-D-glutamyl-meso-diaminopimelate ligase
LAREHIHMVGIGGTGMASLAGLLHQSGCRVTGSDKALYPPTSVLLQDLGLDVRTGYDRANLDPVPDLTVIGNAISRGNPEAEEVLDRGLNYTSMAGVIEERILPGRHSIVVAGTHGKTTTTAMLAWVLEQAGRKPGYLIGGLPQGLPRSFDLGTGKPFVIEGDEYDTAFFDKGPKFMHYRPNTALLGTVEFDHADIFRDLEHVKSVFRWLTNLIPGNGLLVRHEACDVTREVSDHALSRIQGYGLNRGEWQVDELVEDHRGIEFVLLRDGQALGRVLLSVGGEHNVLNSLAVAAAAAEIGLSSEEICRGLSSFQGVKRRLEFRGEAGGVKVLDDFAHHPTAIRLTLQSVRNRYPGSRIWAVLEPRSWSMRRNVFQERLVGALDHADQVVLSQVFGMDAVPEELRLDVAKLESDLQSQGTGVCFLPHADAIVEKLATATTPGDVVVIMSNGGFGGIHEKLLNTLAMERAGS